MVETIKQDAMRNLASLLVVLSLSLVSMAKTDRAYKRLDRLYHSNQWKCLKISKRYIKYLPDRAAPYYYASIVYRNKSKTHGNMKTRYMMMSKSIGYAMKFEKFEDLDLQTKVNWEGYLEELRLDTDSLIREMETTDLAQYGERLKLKHYKMVESREDIVLITVGTDGPPVIPPVVNPNENEQPETSSNQEEENAKPNSNAVVEGFFGLASGREVAPSYNKIQEQELLRLINEQRQELFLPPLRFELSLTRAARYHAYDMAKQNYLRQDSFDPKDGDLVRVSGVEERVGQFHPQKHFKGQNISGGTINAEDTFNDWIQYDEQSDVLFDEDSKKVGIGIYHDPNSEFKYYWVLVTAKR